MRRTFSIEEGDAQAGGGQPPAAPDHTAELAAAKAETAAAQQALAGEKRWADAARGYDAKLAQMSPEDQRLVIETMAGRSTAPPDVTDDDGLDEPTKTALSQLQTEVRGLTARNEALTKQIDGLNGARIEENITGQIAQARAEMGTEVVDALLPQIESQVRADESLTRIPGGVLTLLRAADHGQVADRLKAQRQSDEDERQAKLARTRGLPARGLNMEATPGTDQKPKSALDALNLAIRTEEERQVATR